jgi:hypothetical protein
LIACDCVISQGYSTAVATVDVATKYYTTRSLRSPATTVEACCPLTRDQNRIVVNESTGTTAATLGDLTNVINRYAGVRTCPPSCAARSAGITAACAALPNSDCHGGNNIATRSTDDLTSTATT